MHYIQHLVMARSTRWPGRLSRKLARESVEGVSLINALRVEPELGTARDVAAALKTQGVLVHIAGTHALRACTHLDVSASQAARAADGIRRAVRRASITARDSANVVRLTASDGTLTISSNTPDVGKAQEDIKVQAEGDAIPVAFNAKFLLDALSNMDAPEVFFDLTGPLSPGALRPVEHTDYVYVLAPVRVYG